jgi:SAM-dependent methyltransferase
MNDAVLAELERIARSGGEEAAYTALRRLSLEEVGTLFLDVPSRCPALTELMPRMPSDEIQRRWNGNSGPVLLAQGVSFVATVADAFESLTGRPLAGARVLDYGCGWGRLIRLMYKFTGPDRIYGCDAWGTSLDFCRDHGIRAHLAACDEIPADVPFRGTTFDLIYAFSVFTHLSERTAKAVMAVLRRCVEPDGLLAITIRPVEYWDARVAPEGVVDAARMRTEHAARGFAFTPLDRAPFDGELTYGDTSMSLEYIRTSWPGWAVVAAQLDAADPNQQIVFLRPA